MSSNAFTAHTLTPRVHFSIVTYYYVTRSHPGGVCGDWASDQGETGIGDALADPPEAGV